MAAFSAGMTLADYLAHSASRRFALGTWDCAVFLSDWGRALSGRDPLDGVRGRYANVRQYRRLLRREGGYLASTSTRLQRLGFVVTEHPAAGDVAVVLAPTRNGHEPTGAIVVNAELSAVVTPDLGLVIAPSLPLLRAWSFHA